MAKRRTNEIDGIVITEPGQSPLFPDPTTRASAYRALFDEALPDEFVDEIRSYL